ncbi:MAG: imidazole glycerol phosphate synthase subunit HisH [Chitinophagaceae bacterium]
MIALIDYGSGNINAIANIYKRLNIEFEATKDPERLKKAKKLILPGVGDFDETMELLNNLGVVNALNELVGEKKIPILGVCVGMQILGESSEEGKIKGFGWIKGNVRKIDESLLKTKPHLPHMGWNTVNPVKKDPVFDNVNKNNGFYFLHSYYFDCQNQEDILATSDYGKTFASAIKHENVYGFQFHPEKSHQNGVELFKNFANI